MCKTMTMDEQYAIGDKGFVTRGKAEEGRIFYEEGIALAKSTKKTCSNNDAHLSTGQNGACRRSRRR